MRLARYLGPTSAPAALLLAAAFFLGQAGDGPGASVSAAAASTMAVDANTKGNSAASLGPIDPCLSVEKGDTFSVDVVITDVNQLLAWEIYFVYDRSLVEITDRNVQLLLLSSPGSRVIDISESLPDFDGIYRMAAADIGSGHSESGAGILVRLDLQARAEGLAKLDLPQIDVNDDGTTEFGSTLTNNSGKQIGDDNGDGFYDGPMSPAQVAVGEPCPAPPPSKEPEPATSGGPAPPDDGTADTTDGEQPSGSEDSDRTPGGSEDDGAAAVSLSEDEAAAGGASEDGSSGSDEDTSPESEATPDSPEALGGGQEPSSGDGFAYWMAAPISLGAVLLLGAGFASVRALRRRMT